ncbi:dullard-like phosphatase domain protein [Theileria parva strain Muguga]|uniref:Nuclear LIM interactor-interacting factor 1, putative n=1 Tax=Theileria parva TaxID=5875 RepID=Q4N0T1_THEPA|nr:dullard-like phosphatase domain protein [Theileria parva strain Muguga]EAN30762.1 dullard-like phosphatase domain protein [Theileria parva strain Muguga]|eukprot:XP_763045.1 nuclear LIM interactor-interacting factor 1 [Theileria parva strain Muguga]
MEKSTTLIRFNEIYTIPEDSNLNDTEHTARQFNTVTSGTTRYEVGIAKERRETGFTYGTTLVPKVCTVRKKMLVLDLDETLIHSSFEPSNNSFPMQLMQNGVERTIYIGKRPYLSEFLSVVSNFYEIVIFTAGLKSYADPVIDFIDPDGVCKRRLFRDSCKYWNGYYIKDLEILNKPLKDVVTIDNSPCCYCLNPENAIPIETWFNDENDSELCDLVPLLRRLAHTEDVTNIIPSLFNHEIFFTKVTISQIKQL